MSGRLARSVGLIGLATLSSRLLGLVRDLAQSWYFGTGYQADAFTLATRLPSLLRDLFAEGAMSAAFVPTFTYYLTKEGKAAAWRLGAQVVNALLIVTGAVVVLGIVFAEPLVKTYAEDFATQAEGKLELTVQLTRLNMPFLMLVAVAAAFMGMLNAMRRFFIPSMSPAMYNVIFIACAFGLTPLFMAAGIPPIMSLTVGMLLGGLAQIVAQWPALRREGYRHAWILNWRDPGLRQVLILMGPGTIGVAAAQINLLVNTILATSEAGAPTALSYAFRFMYLPVGIFGVSVATAAIPELSRFAAAEAYDDMRRTLSWSLRLMLVLSIPATVGLMTLAVPIVELVYQRGEFDASSVALVAAAVFAYAPGIVGYSIVKIASPSFYALRDARTPLLISGSTIVLNLVLNLALHRVMGFRGLAYGTAIAAIVNAWLLLAVLSRRIGGIEAGRVGVTLLKITAASAAMAGACLAADAALHRAWPAPEFFDRLVRVGGGISVGIGTLLAASWILHIDELREAMRRVVARVRR